MSQESVKIGDSVIQISLMKLIIAYFVQTLIIVATVVHKFDVFEARVTAIETRFELLETGRLKIGYDYSKSNTMVAYKPVLFYDNKKQIIVPPRI